MSELSLNNIYRVLVIDDHKEVIERVANMDNSTTRSPRPDVKIEVVALYVEVIAKEGDNSEFEISNETIEKLVKLSSKPFNYIITDFGFVSDSKIYDDLPKDNVGEIIPEALKEKVFTPVDLFAKVKDFYLKRKQSKAYKNLQANFLNFNGKLSIYSYWDKRFNKVYHSLGERAFITRNLFPNATFDKLHDIRQELVDNNDSYKQNEHHFTFLKCKFISQLIQLSVNEHILQSNSGSGTEEIVVNKDENPFFSFSNYFRTWKKLGFLPWRSWKHWQLSLFWAEFIFFLGFSPFYLITHPRTLDGYFEVSSDFYPFMTIVLLAYITIMIGTGLYAFDVFSQTFNANKEIKAIKGLYFFSFLACIISVMFCWYALSKLNTQGNIRDVVETIEHNTKYIFYGLLSIDILMLIAKFREMAYYRNKKMPLELRSSLAEKGFIFNQLLFIDIPVLLGVTFIYEFTHRASDYFETVTNQQELYKTFLIVGSIGMHIIFSQFIFLVLNTRNIYSEIIKGQTS